jgi:hypothetical protein
MYSCMCVYRKHIVKNRHTCYFSDDSVISCLVNPSVYSHVSKNTWKAESSSTSLIHQGTCRHGKRTLVEKLQRTELLPLLSQISSGCILKALLSTQHPSSITAANVLIGMAHHVAVLEVWRPRKGATEGLYPISGLS